MFHNNISEQNRVEWLRKTLRAVPAGWRLLDAGAGELRNRAHCDHLRYVSQDFGQYEGAGDGMGFQTGTWDTTRVDILSDITAIPEPDGSFDAILCSEVLEHVPDPQSALNEFTRLLRPGGRLILTAPLASWVHFAPYHYCTGFSRYWYEYHLPRRGLHIQELSPNGDWFAYCRQEIQRLGSMSRQYGDPSWPLAYLLGIIATAYFRIRGGRSAEDLACFGWHCVAIKTA